MPATPKASPAADFAEPETKLIVLPRKGAGGKELSVLIRAVPTIELVKAMHGVPALNRSAGVEGASEQTFEQVRQVLIENERPQQAIAALGVVEPAFWFGEEPEEGKAPWRNVHGENQLFVVAEIMALSGFGPAQTAAAKSADTFLGVDGK